MLRHITNSTMGWLHTKGQYFMNSDLIYMLGLLVVFAISGLLAYCFTESKGENTPYARRKQKSHQYKQPAQQSEPILEDEDDVIIH